MCQALVWKGRQLEPPDRWRLVIVPKMFSSAVSDPSKIVPDIFLEFEQHDRMGDPRWIEVTDSDSAFRAFKALGEHIWWAQSLDLVLRGDVRLKRAIFEEERKDAGDDED